MVSPQFLGLCHSNRRVLDRGPRAWSDLPRRAQVNAAEHYRTLQPRLALPLLFLENCSQSSKEGAQIHPLDSDFDSGSRISDLSQTRSRRISLASQIRTMISSWRLEEGDQVGDSRTRGAERPPSKHREPRALLYQARRRRPDRARSQGRSGPTLLRSF